MVIGHNNDIKYKTYTSYIKDKMNIIDNKYTLDKINIKDKINKSDKNDIPQCRSVDLLRNSFLL